MLFMSFDPTRLAKTLHTLLQQARLSANQLADIIDVPQPTITRIISGETTKPRIDTLCKLADHFGITVSQLIGETPLAADQGLAELETAYQQLSAYKRNTALSIVRAIAAEPDAPYG